MFKSFVHWHKPQTFSKYFFIIIIHEKNVGKKFELQSIELYSILHTEYIA